MSKPPRGISGRWFTICFGLLLAMGVVLGFTSVIRFQETMSALDSVRSLWPEAAATLEERYRIMDGLLSKIDTSESEEVKARVRDWEEARRLFKSSTQYDVQSRAVPSLEALAKRLNLARDIEPSQKTSAASLEKFLDADRALGSLQSDALGSLCKLLFRLKIPTPIYSILE
jgi:hypothetical protein